MPASKKSKQKSENFKLEIFYLADYSLSEKRPDIMRLGRMVFGSQVIEGKVPEHRLFLSALEEAAFKAGLQCEARWMKTHHHLSCPFDQARALRSLARELAPRFHLICLFDEAPYLGTSVKKEFHYDTEYEALLSMLEMSPVQNDLTATLERLRQQLSDLGREAKEKVMKELIVPKMGELRALVDKDEASGKKRFPGYKELLQIQ